MPSAEFPRRPPLSNGALCPDLTIRFGEKLGYLQGGVPLNRGKGDGIPGPHGRAARAHDDRLQMYSQDPAPLFGRAAQTPTFLPMA